MRRLSDFTHIGRTVDPRHPPVLLAVLASAGTGLLFLALDGGDLRRAVSAAAAAFAAWAIARELDPDRPTAAAVAALTVPASTLLLGVPAPAALFVTMIGLRVVARTTGLPPKTTDLAVVTAGAVLVADTPWGWAAGILLAFALVRDVGLGGEPPDNAGLWGAVLAVGVTIRVAVADALGVWDRPDFTALGVLALGLAGAALVLRPVPVLSIADWTRDPLDPNRIREAAVFGTLTAVLAVVAGGHEGIVAMAPLLLAFPAVAVVRTADG